MSLKVELLAMTLRLSFWLQDRQNSASLHVL